MTSDDRLRAASRAIRATLEGDSSVVDGLFAGDVQASFSTSVWSAPGLAVEIEDRAGAFEDVDLHVTRARELDRELWVEWTASVFHSGALAVEDVVIPPTGRRTELHGITVVEFDGALIRGFRQYWDTAALLDDGGSSPDAPSRPHRNRLQRG